MNGLFAHQPIENLLPYDGEVVYLGLLLNHKEAASYFMQLLHQLEWKNDEAVMYGKRIVTARKVAWYADQPFGYTYSGATRLALPWTDELLKLKQCVEAVSGEPFNSCLLNLYHNGQEGMAWHSDDEKELVKHGCIASLSLGAARKFVFKHRTSKETIALVLEPGSLLLMKKDTQDHWLHSLPKTTKVTEPRINLTFRQMKEK